MGFDGCREMNEGFVRMGISGFVKKGNGGRENGVLVVENPMFVRSLKCGNLDKTRMG